MKSLKNIFSLLEKNEKVKFYKLSFLAITASILETVGIASIFPLINLLTGKGETFNFLNNLNIEIHFISENQIVGLMIIIFLIYLLKNIFLSFFYWFENKFSYVTRFNLGNRLFNNYLNSPFSFHLENHSSSLTTKIEKETALFGSSLMSLSALITETLIIVGITTLLLIIKPFETICVIGIISLFGFVFYIFTKKIISNLGIKLVIAQKEKMKVLNESLKSIKEIIIFRVSDYFYKIFSLKSMEAASHGYKMSFINRLPKIWFEMGALFIISFIVILYITKNDNSSEILATSGIFLISSLKIIPSINKILVSIQNIRYANAAVNSMSADLNNKKIFIEVNQNLSEDQIKFNEEILFKDISLKYKNNQEDILKNLNLKIKKKDFIAIIGKTGSGKISFINILMGLIKPSTGQVLVDNFNINNNLVSWRKKIGYVPQNITLIEDTLYKNIAYGISQESISQKKLDTSIQLSKLSDFLQNKNQNFFIGEDGSKISGGQRQRIAIARALYHDPEILILDEPTSSLDAMTSQKLFQSLHELNKYKTIIIISHDITDFKIFNKVFEIKNKLINQIK
mgnify:CR=1 FL=1